MQRSLAVIACSVMLLVGSLLTCTALLAQQPACTPPPPNLVAWWPGDGNFSDIVGSNTGTPVNDVLFVPGEVAQAFSLNEPGPIQNEYDCPTCAYIAVANHLPASTNAVTVAAWVYADQSQQEAQDNIEWVYTQFDDADCGPIGTCGPQLGIAGTNSIIWRPNGDDEGEFAGALPSNTWTFLVGTYDSGTGLSQLYLNGSLVQSQTFSGAVPLTNPPFIGMRIGQQPQEFWVGRIDELQLFTSALSADEILTIYNAGSAGECKGVTLTPAKISFGTVLVGTTSPLKTATLTNVSTSTIDIFSIETAGEFGQSNTCTGSLAPGANCVIDVSFTPTMKGNESSQLLVNDSAYNSPQVVLLSGAGSYVQLTPLKLSFGKEAVGTTSAAQTVTLTNTSTAALTIMNISISGTDSGDFAQTNTCGNSVGAGKSCTISVTFTPTADGNRAAQVTINDNGGGSPQKVLLTGIGT